MTVQLTDDEISKLERQRRIIRCVAVVCRVCGFRQHAPANGFLPSHEHCPKGCVLPPRNLGECRLCGDPIESRGPRACCAAHTGRNLLGTPNGCYTTHIAETHWHAADRTGPVSQYAKTGE